MQQLEGKTAIVTGAASGIGLGMARAFAREGMAVVLCDIRGDRLDAALAEVRALGAKAIAVVTDVSDRASVRDAGDAAVKAFGALHVACNNAGVTIHGRSVAELTPQEWEWNIGVNLYGVIHGLEIFLPLIRRHGGEGHIVNTASIAGFQIGGHRRSGSYGAMKFAVVALSESIAYDLKDHADRRLGAGAGRGEDAHLYVGREPARALRRALQRAGQQCVPERARRRAGAGRRRRARGARDPAPRVLCLHPHAHEGLALARHQRIIDAFDECEQWIAEEPQHANGADGSRYAARSEQ